MEQRAKEDGWKKMPNGRGIFVRKGETLREAFEREEHDKKSAETRHREYLEQNKFKKLDDYDDQVIHDKGRQTTIKKDDADKLRDEIETLDRLCDTPFMKDRHISNLKADVTKKKENIKSQLSYMESHNMHDSSLYKQLQGFMNKLNSIESKLNKM